MGRRNPTLRLLTAVLTVWCLGCDAFESITGWLLAARGGAQTAAVITDVSTGLDNPRPTLAGADDGSVDAADSCHCVLGHAAVVSTMIEADRPPAASADFADRPVGVPLSAPEPRLRPPVA